jgi:drug/metabolite transporter (DMT)-like permease
VIALIAMLGWSAYTLLQTKAVVGLSFLARVCVFAFAGALFSLPPAIIESINAPQRVFSSGALGVYLFAGLVQAGYSIPIAVREIGPMLDQIHGKEKLPPSSGISR